MIVVEHQHFVPFFFHLKPFRWHVLSCSREIIEFGHRKLWKSISGLDLFLKLIPKRLELVSRTLYDFEPKYFDWKLKSFQLIVYFFRVNSKTESISRFDLPLSYAKSALSIA